MSTYFILGFPHVIALGVLAGILEFTPMAGWMIAATTIISVGFLTHSHGLVMAVLLGIWRMLMDYPIAPRVLGHELEIPPLLAIFTLMVGAPLSADFQESTFLYLWLLQFGLYCGALVVPTLR